MLEKDIVELLKNLVSNVAGLQSELILPIKAKKLWTTAHTFKLNAESDAGLNHAIRQLQDQGLAVSGNGGSNGSLMWFNIANPLNTYTVEIVVGPDSKVFEINVTPKIEDLDVYTKRFCHSVSIGESGVQVETTQVTVDYKLMFGDKLGEMSETFIECAIKALQKHSFARRKKAMKQSAKSDKKPKDKKKKDKKKAKKSKSK